MTGPFEYPDEVLDEICSPFFEEQLDNFDEVRGLYKDEEEEDLKDGGVPTREDEEYWIHAISKHKYKKSTKDCGKWMLFIPEKHIDAAWQQVKDALENGQLGKRAKVSTKFGKRSDDYVICVYTYSWKDEKDVTRIREVLRDLGFTRPIPYKTDEDTLKGKYFQPGKPLSKYYE